MKTLVTILAIVIATSCRVMEPLQVTPERVTLIRIETVGRFGGDKIVFHWRTDRGIVYESYPDKIKYIPLGTVDTVFVRR